MRRERRALAWGLAALSAGLTAFALVVEVRDGLGWHGFLGGRSGLQAVMALTFPVLGALLLTRASGNRLGWVFSLIGLSRGVTVFARAWALHDFDAGGNWAFADELAFVALLMMFVAPVLVPLTLLWFPDGELPDRRRRWRIGQGSVVVSGIALLVLLWPAWSLRGPALLDDSPAPRLAMFGLGVIVAGAVAGVLCGLVAVVSRLRGRDRVVRQQVKWYLYGAVTAFVLNMIGDVGGLGILNLAGLLAFEAAVFVAVRRYALWDIDRILNRTVVYGLLSVTVLAVWSGCVVGLGLLLGEVSFGRSGSVAAATLAAAVVAGPVRHRLQTVVDRRFDRRAYDAVRRVTQYGERAALGPTAPGELEQLLRDVLRDPGLKLLFRRQNGGLIDAWGRSADEPAGEPTRFRGAAGELAVLIHRPFPPHERTLLTDVHHAATGAVALARLQAELLVQLAVVEQSRRRIIEASGAERRRVERDLHDGAQQRLVALAMSMRSEQRRHAAQLSPEAGRIIDLGVSEIRGSIADLRALAAGLLPGSLVSEGLAPALRELIDRQPDHVEYLTRIDHRHAPEIEATAWFVAAEGLANSLKHAPGSRISLDALCDGRRLQISVSDNGPGGAKDGPGLTGLEDRVHACSGTLGIESPPGIGTTLTAVLPCG